MLKMNTHNLYRVPVALILGFLGQWAWSRPGAVFLFIGAVLFLSGIYLLLSSDVPRRLPLVAEKIPFFQECFLFGSILILAFVLRIYGLDSQPPGTYLDQGFAGWGGLRILHEGWRPMGVTGVIFTWPTLLYQIGAWFILFKPTTGNLSLFFVFLAMAGFPFVYLFFRELAGIKSALLSLFFLSVMYWHMNLCRNGHLVNQVYFPVFATLFLWVYGLKKRNKWVFALTALVCAMGLYSYQSYKVFPLLMGVYIFYEITVRSRASKLDLSFLRVFLAVFFIVSFPVIYDWIRHGFFTGRETPFFIGRVIWEQKSLKPLWDNLIQWVLLFNHQGDPDPLNRVGQEAMLDPITGVFFLFGLLYALKTPLRRDHFYPLAGFFILSLPSLLAVGLGSYRMAAALPMVAFFASKAFWFSWEGWSRKLKNGQRNALGFVMGGMLLIAGILNSKAYFVDLVLDNDRWHHFSMDATSVGKAVREHADTDFCLPSYFYDHPTVLFLTYFHQDQVHRSEIPQGLTPPLGSQRPQVCFVIDRGKKGLLDLIRNLYPGGKVEESRDLKGDLVVSFYYVPRETVDSFRGLRKIGAREWVGGFRADEAGLYRFHLPSSPSLQVDIGGLQVHEGKGLYLESGYYAFHWRAQGTNAPNGEFVTPHGEIRSLDGACLTQLPLDHGLLCRFSRKGAATFPALRWDPLLNFVSTGDLPYPDFPFQADWSGEIDCPSPGSYGFLILTSEKTEFWLDGKKLLGSAGQSVQIQLSKGRHDLHLILEREKPENEVRMDLHLLWRKPGSKEFEIIPSSAFGKTHSL